MEILEWPRLGLRGDSSGACANSSTNRFFQAGTEDVTIDLVCYGECVGCDVEVTEYEVTFNVNMANETVAESGVTSQAEETSATQVTMR